MQHPDVRRLTVVAASARALAWSARRAGLEVDAYDLFADSDLGTIAHVDRIPAANWPHSLSEHDFPRAQPLVYGGALENHPDVVDAIGARVQLLGIAGAGLRGVRDPWTVAEVLTAQRLPCPRVCRFKAELPRDGCWLAKPRKSAGGRGIRTAESDASADHEAVYYQERIDGLPCSALFVGYGQNGARLIGATRQLIGRMEHPFAYRGSIGPLELGEESVATLRRLGEVLSVDFGLRGLFGIDFVFRDRMIWPVEVNPRYTASVEVLELALRRPLLAEHLLAFDDKTPDSNSNRPVPPPERYVGKCVIFAPCDCELLPVHQLLLMRETDEQRERDPFAVFTHADIPVPGSLFRVGDPVLTIFAAGPTLMDCERRLSAREQRWLRRLRPTTAARRKSR